jgi:hypothetical protein
VRAEARSDTDDIAIDAASPAGRDTGRSTITVSHDDLHGAPKREGMGGYRCRLLSVISLSLPAIVAVQRFRPFAAGD